MLSFGQRTGYLPLNVGAAVKLPAKKDTLAERILTEPDVHRLLALEPMIQAMMPKPAPTSVHPGERGSPAVNG